MAILTKFIPQKLLMVCRVKRLAGLSERKGSDILFRRLLGVVDDRTNKRGGISHKARARYFDCYTREDSKEGSASI